MSILEELLKKKTTISIIGLGYVGLPIALAFDKIFNVIGFDISINKIKMYLNGIDPTNEMGNTAIKDSSIFFTSDEKKLKKALFHIVAVPTPINQDKTPNLKPIIDATKIIGNNLSRGSFIVYESTVYPGVTEEVCIPLLEEISGLQAGIDFNVGYSPERINPGDKVHTLENIVKIVSSQNDEATENIASVYAEIIKAGIHKVSSIKVAEATKVVENSQRDINIAFMNELAMVFNRMEIDSKEVIDAMNTKWNALGFTPGLVGGHCIGVDPHYFIYQAEKLGYHSQIILGGRKINDGMPNFIVENTIKKLIESDILVKKAKIAILGLTFKENTNDIRNSKVFDIITGFKEYGLEILIVDPYINSKEIDIEYELQFSNYNDLEDLDAIIMAVAHDKFMNIDLKELSNKFRSQDKKILIDVKSFFDINQLKLLNYRYWRL